MSIAIKLVRVDKRLLHATIALNWNQFVNANYVIIVDPSYVDDSFIEQVLQLSLPKSMKLSIFSVDQLIAFLQADSGVRQNVMIIFKDLGAVKSAVEAGFVTKEVQIPYPASRFVIKNLSDFFSSEEVEQIRFIQSKGIKLFFQTAPLDNKDYSAFNIKEK